MFNVKLQKAVVEKVSRFGVNNVEVQEAPGRTRPPGNTLDLLLRSLTSCIVVVELIKNNLAFRKIKIIFTAFSLIVCEKQ